MSPELQVKLLTILQRRKVTKVGSNEVIDVDVRIICATNAPLSELVRNNLFRSDLYYRINTVEINLPPLRQRKEDIPALFQHYFEEYTKRYHKALTADEVLIHRLTKYGWPGNIRELENIIERSVLLTTNNIITNIVLPDQQKTTIDPQGGKEPIKTIEENERDHIIAALRSCKGKISGEGGAAELLRIHVSTLNSKIKKLGIKREHYFTIEKD